MEGMGHMQVGASITLVTVGAVTASVLFLALFLTMGGTPGKAAETTGTNLPDLVIVEVYNLTPVYQGEDSFFIVTIENRGTAAYLVRTSGDLEVTAFRESESEIAGITKVFWDLYRGCNVTVNLKVRFDTLGSHTLRIVLDNSDLVDERDENNNRATLDIVVVPSEENRPPDANGGNDRFGYVNEPVLFSARYSKDPDGDTLSYSWVFGDEGTGRFTNHTYLFVGDYGASLMVGDGEKIDIDTFVIHVTQRPINNPPTAVITVGRTSVHVDVELMFDGRASTDPNLDRLTYDWDFDATDGTDDWVRGMVVYATWEETGAYIVTLKVSDGQESSQATTTITVSRPPPPNIEPKAKAGPDIETKVGESLQIRGERSDPDGMIVKWEWDLDNDGSFDTYNEHDGTLYRTFDEPGRYTLKLRVTDDRGGTSTDSIIVKVEKADDGKDTPGPGVLFSMAALAIVTILMKNRPRGERWRWYKG